MGKHTLAGKVVVITGASSGAGRAMAEEFSKYNTKLVLAARRMDALNQIAETYSRGGSQAIAVETDVTDYAQVKNLVSKTVETFGRIDIWVNNAGVLAAGPFEKTPMEVHDEVIKTNLMGYMHGAHAVLPVFKTQQRGILINNISVGGYFAAPYAAGYSASKFGLKGFSDALKGELINWKQIHVCDLFPAFIDTPGIKHAANYTGRVLKPAPPVYDPRKLSRAAVRVAMHPRHSTKVGAVAYLLKLGVSLAPAMTRSVAAGVMKTYFANAEKAPETSGNVFEPIAWGTSIDGTGEGKPGRLAKAAAFTAGIMLTSLILSINKRRTG